MSASSDPSDHRRWEDQFVQHVDRLLLDDRLRLDTISGRRPVTSLIRDVNRTDAIVELTRLMSGMDKPDRELRDRMPRGQKIDVRLSRKQWWLFRKAMGAMKVVCVSPNEALLNGSAPAPLSRAELTQTLQDIGPVGGIPVTVVVMSTSGFAIEANELAERRADRTVILASPNAAGGWNIVGPPETKALVDLFDPELDAEKRRRVRKAIEESRADLSGAGLASDRLASEAQVPPALVESELKQYARENAGLVAKRLDGRMVLFRSAIAAGESGGVMPLIDKMKALFARKGETEKKIAFLAERRTALSQQRDRGYEEIGELELREGDLRKQFKEAGGDLTKRRITSQLLQLRKDIERRQQLLSVLNQQINVVATHLHNLELVHQGKTAQLPDSDEIAQDAAAAEEAMAELQASSELAESVGGTVQAGLNAEEQALYEELERSNQPAQEKAASPAPASPQPARSEPARAPQPPQRARPEAE